MVSDNQVAIELLTEIFSWQIIDSVSRADAGYRGKRRLAILDASVSIGNRSTSWAIGVCGPIKRTFSWFGWFRRLTLE